MTTTYQALPPLRQLYTQSVNALAFDPVSDILWTGNSIGGVVALYGSRGDRGVAFRVGGDSPVKKILAGDNYVRATGSDGNGVGSWGKGGINNWYFRPDQNVATFSNNSINSSNIIAVSTSSNTPELLLVNSSTGKLLRQTVTSSPITHLIFSHTHLLSGSADGHIRTHDIRVPDFGQGVSTVQAHAMSIQNFDVAGNFIFSIGWGVRQSRPYPDALVKVYDMRNMRALPPIPFPAVPGFINILPKRSSSVVITSNRGLVNIVDASNPNSAGEFYQLDVPSYVSSVAVSPTSVYLAFGDADGVIHLLTAAAEEASLPLNGFDGQPIEWFDTPEPLPNILWNESTPLNSVGMPYYKSQLLSSWTSQFTSTNYFPPPPKIPPQVLESLKVNEFVKHATLPKELRGRRNIVPAAPPKKDHARFRSGKSRNVEPEPETPIKEYDVDKIPRIYRRVEIEYSKFGVEDFDFGFYNKTQYSGLETHIRNSYTNAMVQVMHYMYPIRRIALSHITTNCPREHCLLCELGFVMRMLNDASGTNCQASNFCKTVGVLTHASNSLQLVDYGRTESYADTIQSFHRFLIDHLISEGNNFPHNPTLVSQYQPQDPHSPSAVPMTQLLGLDAKTIIVCDHCKVPREKENMSHIVDLVYPKRDLASHVQPPATFVSILQNSLVRETHYRATCPLCMQQFSSLVNRRAIPSKDLPPILAVNAAIHKNESHLKYWLDDKDGSFLTPKIEIRGQIDGGDDSTLISYELRALIVQITSNEQSQHLVAIIKVPEAENHTDLISPWFVFNDFMVSNVSEKEALSFAGKWKVPAVLYFERMDMRDRLDYASLPDNFDSSILSRDISISPNRDLQLSKHELLRYDEMPKPGTLVSIDAEFVLMEQEESEVRSDGTKKVIRPPRMSLARVSVLRGDGSKESVPFIDDYIHTSEMIVDYLTEFSGIRHGDLDPHTSRHTLAPLKVVYKKLRLLVDLGCIFVGHGLSKDFRIINLYVPPEQVIDTVDLYFIRSRQRRLSLRFLTWFLLKENIQEDTHDSIEDARCALMLYKAYQRFEEQGVFDEKLDELYREGKQYNWRPPALQTSVSATTNNSSRIIGPPAFGVGGVPNPSTPLQQNPYSPTMYPISSQPTLPIKSNMYSLSPHQFANQTQWNRGRR